MKKNRKAWWFYWGAHVCCGGILYILPRVSSILDNRKSSRNADSENGGIWCQIRVYLIPQGLAFADVYVVAVHFLRINANISNISYSDGAAQPTPPVVS